MDRDEPLQAHNVSPFPEDLLFVWNMLTRSLRTIGAVKEYCDFLEITSIDWQLVDTLIKAMTTLAEAIRESTRFFPTQANSLTQLASMLNHLLLSSITQPIAELPYDGPIWNIPEHLPTISEDSYRQRMADASLRYDEQWQKHPVDLSVMSNALADMEDALRDIGFTENKYIECFNWSMTDHDLLTFLKSIRGKHLDTVKQLYSFSNSYRRPIIPTVAPLVAASAEDIAKVVSFLSRIAPRRLDGFVRDEYLDSDDPSKGIRRYWGDGNDRPSNNKPSEYWNEYYGPPPTNRIRRYCNGEQINELELALDDLLNLALGEHTSSVVDAEFLYKDTNPHYEPLETIEFFLAALHNLRTAIDIDSIETMSHVYRETALLIKAFNRSFSTSMTNRRREVFLYSWPSLIERFSLAQLSSYMFNRLETHIVDDDLFWIATRLMCTFILPTGSASFDAIEDADGLSVLLQLCSTIISKRRKFPVEAPSEEKLSELFEGSWYERFSELAQLFRDPNALDLDDFYTTGWDDECPTADETTEPQ